MVLYFNGCITCVDSVMCVVLATNRIVNFLVLVLEWTVTFKPNVEHGKMVGYGGC